MEVEAIQLVARLLGVHDILVDHKRRTLGVACYPLTYLPGSSVSFVPVHVGDVCWREGVDVPYRTEFPKQLEQIVGRDVVALLPLV